MAGVSVGELAGLLGADLLGDGAVRVSRIDAMERAGPGCLTFIRSRKYALRFPESKASAALITRDVAIGDLVPGFDPAVAAFPRPILVVGDADVALIRCAEFFAPPVAVAAPGVHPTAVIEAGAEVAASAGIGPHCVIREGAVIGEKASLIAGVYVGAGAKIGEGTILHPGVRVLDRCEIGKACIVHANAVIGADGFGYRPAPDGRGLLKIPHIGNVIVGDAVEIGAGTCIDRAKFGATTIGDGTKIDNMVQIGHGCRIGRSCAICGQVGLAGSVTIGDGVMLGGQVGVADNIEIGDGAKVAGGSAVHGGVPPGGVYMGAPAEPAGEWRRMYGTLRRLRKRQGPEGKDA